MAIHKFTQFTVEAEICGQARDVSWEAVEGILAITGIHSFAEAAEILEKLSSGGMATFEPPPAGAPATQQAHREEVAQAASEVQRAAAAGHVPAAAPTTQPIATGEALPRYEDKPPVAVVNKGDQPLDVAATELAVFGRMNKLGEVVDELRKRGKATYEAILAACESMASAGDICPALDVLSEQGKLVERLKVHLAGKGIAVPA